MPPISRWPRDDRPNLRGIRSRRRVDRRIRRRGRSRFTGRWCGSSRRRWCGSRTRRARLGDGRSCGCRRGSLCRSLRNINSPSVGRRNVRVLVARSQTAGGQEQGGGCDQGRMAEPPDDGASLVRELTDHCTGRESGACTRQYGAMPYPQIGGKLISVNRGRAHSEIHLDINVYLTVSYDIYLRPIITKSGSFGLQLTKDH